MRRIIIAIDGVSGSGKSTTAKAVAQKLGYRYIDTGAMYRAVTLYFLNRGVDLSDRDQVLEALDRIDIEFRPNQQDQRNEILLNGKCVEDQIRTLEVSRRVSQVSSLPEVREALRSKQQRLGKNKGVVMDGRDIGTTIFPEAELKIFLTADVAVRARRRQLDFQRVGEAVDLTHIEENLEERDYQDQKREYSPLVKADDAHEIDTSTITLEEQIDQVFALAQERLAES